jgi:hypothetical protein
MLGSYGVRRRTRDGRLVETWGCGVEISVDGGETWRETALGNDLGRFGFRAFSFPFTPARVRRRWWKQTCASSFR